MTPEGMVVLRPKVWLDVVIQAVCMGRLAYILIHWLTDPSWPTGCWRLRRLEHPMLRQVRAAGGCMFVCTRITHCLGALVQVRASHGWPTRSHGLGSSYLRGQHGMVHSVQGCQLLSIGPW